MEYVDPSDNKNRYIPYVVEPSLGVDRLTLAMLCSSWEEQDLSKDGKEDSRVVMHFHPAIAPFKAAVLPLSKKLAEPAMKIYQDLAKYFNVDYDQSGSIGKLYRRQDEIGTPFCITVDFDTENDGCVTVRDRDSMEQVRMPIGELRNYIEQAMVF
jgi:glycyl-tRNA synthetase